MTDEHLTRRQLMERGGVVAGGMAALGLAGVVGFEMPHGQPPPPAPTAAPLAHQQVTEKFDPDGLVQRFATHPDLLPPAVTVSPVGGTPMPTSPPYFFLSSKAYPRNSRSPGQPGNMIVDRAGDLIWFEPNTQSPYMDFNTQTYRGKPVLTWWSGEDEGGHGQGAAYIADTSYKPIATVKAANGLMVDLHEFVITAHDTALVTAYRTVPADLSNYHGPEKGLVLSGVCQEIDIATGKLLFEWDSMDHVPLSEAQGHDYYVSDHGQHKFDYFHINSLSYHPDGDLLISGRNTWCVYKVSRKDGHIVWRLGGKSSDFRLEKDAQFCFQHHVRPVGSAALTIFDDGGGPPRVEKQSRALLLDYDETTKRASVGRQYTHPAHLSAQNQGSMQLFPDGRVCVGWGDQPYFSEFDADGKMVTDGQLPVGDASYRVYAADWQGAPTTTPAILARSNPAGGTLVYASWNGATNVAGWRVRSGKTKAAMTDVASEPRRGFETAIAVPGRGPYFSVVPYDATGKALTSSDVIMIKAHHRTARHRSKSGHKTH